MAQTLTSALTPLRAFVAAPLLALWLAACGGGGGGGSGNAPDSVQEPPSQAAALVQSASEARAAVRSVVEGADVVIEQAAGADSFLLPIGGATGGGRESPQVVQTVGCAEIFGPPCSGSVTVDTDIAQSSSVARPGNYIAMTFNDLSASLDGQAFTLDGGLRMVFLSTFDLQSDLLTGLRFEVAATRLSGSSAGVSFGPETTIARVEFSSETAFAVTLDGLRLSDMTGVVSTDAANYGIGAATLRRAYWGDAQTYAESRYTAWNVDAHHVRLNSRARVLAGATRADIVVVSTSTLQTVYEVKLTVGGVAQTYHVTATYPEAGGAPTYTVTVG